MYTDTTPYSITVPANLNMFAPIPRTRPSFLYSSADEVIEWAKPVIGIINADFTLVTNRSNTPTAVNIEAIVMRVNITRTPDSFLGRFSHRL